MKHLRNMTLVFFVFCVILALGGCGKKSFDASGYVKSTLDALYKEDYKEHAAYVEEDEKQLKEEMEADFVSQMEQAMSGMELTDEDKNNYCTFSRKLYALSKYKVGEAEKAEDGNYTVSVTVEPCTFWKTYYAGIEEKLREFSSTKDTFTDSELFNTQLAYMNECLGAPAYDPQKEITVHVTENSNHVYAIPDEDMETLENTMFPVE